MGALTSRQNADVEEAEFNANHAYRFPPKSGNYFGSHFIMGGERFDTPQPESYLFGENADLNFLHSKPTLFPYPPPQSNDPTKTLNSLVNIRKESIRFVKSKEATNRYTVEFVFDADAKCAITIHYLCSEDISPGGMIYASREASLTSETYHYKKGINQLFAQPSHTFNPAAYSDEELAYGGGHEEIPIAIHCVVEDSSLTGAEELRQSHTTICVIDHHADGSYALRALKQKIFVDGLCYLLQEIYGIENKNLNKTAAQDDDMEDTGSECVICMCDMRDTLILPCRHLCLCNSCADSLRYQANNCPICRAPFKALLQVRAVQKSSTSIVHPITMQDSSEGVPNGYQLVSLIEALNGPPNAPPPPPLSGSGPVAAAVVQANNTNSRMQTMGNGPETIGTTAEQGAGDEMPSAVKAAQSLNGMDKGRSQRGSSPQEQNDKEFRLTVMPSETATEKGASLSRKNSGASRSQSNSSLPKSLSRDSVKLVNEKNGGGGALENGTLAARVEENEDDSDDEKLSPLLNKTITTTGEALQKQKSLSQQQLNESAALKGVGNGEDVSDGEEAEHGHNGLHTKNEKESPKEGKKSVATPLASLKETAASLPDSPISGNSTSTRSSGESYSSSSSTRQLLGSGANIDTMTSILDETESPLAKK